MDDKKLIENNRNNILEILDDTSSIRNIAEDSFVVLERIEYILERTETLIEKMVPLLEFTKFYAENAAESLVSIDVNTDN